MSTPTKVTNTPRRFLTSTMALFAMGAAMLAAAPEVLAAPQGGKVAAGSATISSQAVHTGANTTGVATTVNQATTKAVITWTGFNLNSADSVRFNQPNANAITLNEISGPASSVYGTITGNGQLWFINPNGFVFGPGTAVSAGSLLFSTLGIANATGSGFYTNNSGYYQFASPSSASGAIKLDNSTMYSLTPGGYTVLQGQAVNVADSHITTGSEGHVGIAAADGISADFDGDGLVSYAVSGGVAQKVAGQLSSISLNNSTIQTNGGGVMFQALVDKDAVLDHVINLGGDYYDTNGDMSNPAVGNNTVSGGTFLYEWQQ